MRVGLAFVMVAALWAGGAEASSFVVLDPLPAGESPSVVMLGTPAPAVADTATPEPPTEQATATPPAVDPDRASHFEIPREEIVHLSRSVIALGEPEPDVAMEKVAAIDTHGKQRHDGMPMVIRGGVVGDAFSAPSAPVTVSAAPASAEQPAQPASSPASPYSPGGNPASPDPALPPPATPSGPKLEPL